MRTSILIVGAILLVVGGGLAVAGTGMLPGDNGGQDVESFPTETDDTASSDDDTTSNAAEPEDPYAFTVEQIEECGETCRDVTVRLTNEQSSAGSNVTAYTRIYVGNGTDGDVAWEGTEDVGDLEANGSHTATKRVELSYGDAYAVQQEDGWITIQTTIESDEEIMTVTEQRQVA